MADGDLTLLSTLSGRFERAKFLALRATYGFLLEGQRAIRSTAMVLILGAQYSAVEEAARFIIDFECTAASGNAVISRRLMWSRALKERFERLEDLNDVTDAEWNGLFPTLGRWFRSRYYYFLRLA